MATKDYSTIGGQSFNNTDSQATTWLLAAGDDGAPLNMPAYADRSVHIFGNFGGATVVWEGSNEPDTPTPANYITLRDAFGVPISVVGADLRAVTEMARFVRPRVIGGDVTTAITAILLAKR